MPVGQVRISKNKQECIIGISIDNDFRGKSYAVPMLQQAINEYFTQFPEDTIIAYIKETNLPSLTVFQKVGFKLVDSVMEQGVPSYKLVKSLV